MTPEAKFRDLEITFCKYGDPSDPLKSSLGTQMTPEAKFRDPEIAF
jgi:hypothetical protein